MSEEAHRNHIGWVSAKPESIVETLLAIRDLVDTGELDRPDMIEGSDSYVILEGWLIEMSKAYKALCDERVKKAVEARG